MNDTNLKTCVNYQMYISVVQENHNVNIKIVFNLAKNFVYFWTVFTKHPVYKPFCILSLSITFYQWYQLSGNASDYVTMSGHQQQ